jgi:transcriptional regulator with XRE-family HTH domain
MDNTWLRQRLRELRKRCGLTQEELGQRAHLSKQFISDVERGAKGLSVESFFRYARGLGISPLIVFDVDVHPFVGLVRAYAELPPWEATGLPKHRGAGLNRAPKGQRRPGADAHPSMASVIGLGREGDHGSLNANGS